MNKNAVADEVFLPQKWRMLFQMLRKKQQRKRLFQSDLFFQEVMKRSLLPCKSLESLVKKPPAIVLREFFSRNGNLSPYELIAIATLVADRKPLRILEIGTFDGNTTLQIALNAPSEAIIHTLDLPKGQVETKEPVLQSDFQFIEDARKEERKFIQSEVAHKVRQHFGDSTCFDFSAFTQSGPLDLIFIDGGHSYECVKKDTENALAVVAKNGMILWHDFTPHFAGVYRFLSELARKEALVHIAGTNLVLLDRAVQ